MFKTAVALCAGVCALASAAAAADHPDFTGLWRTPTFIPALKTTAGKLPPLRPAALKIYRKRVADRAAGKTVDDPINDCVPHGVPRLMFAPYPLLIVQSNGQVDMVQEANHTQRLIYVDQPPAEPGDPKWLGTSVGHWDGSTLVVETINNDDRTWLDKAGLPHSDQMKVIEKLKLGAGGKTLTDTITIDDPQTYTAPWTTVVHFNRKPGPLDLAERVCADDHKM